MNPPTTTPAVQYTSQMVAIEDSHCERSSCRKLIQKGQPRLYVRNHIEGNSGRYVCEGCFAVYSARSKTTVRVREVTVARGDSVGPTTAQPLNQHARDLASIRSDVNRSQREGVHAAPTGRVVAMGPSSALSYRSNGPTVAIPSHQKYHDVFSAWPRSSQPSQPITPYPSQPVTPTISGYSSAHLQYASAREEWSSAAYQGRASRALQFGSINIKALACYESNVTKSNKGFTYLPRIQEGLKVLSHIQPQELIQVIKSAILPGLEQHAAGFPWDMDTMIVREKDTWQDVGRVLDQGASYFGTRFLKAKPGTSRGVAKGLDTEVFTAPKKPIDFVVVIGALQYIAADEHETTRLLAVERAKEDDRSSSIQDNYRLHRTPSNSTFRTPSPAASHTWEATVSRQLERQSISPIRARSRSQSASPPRHPFVNSKRKAPPSPQTTVGPSKKMLIDIEQFKIGLSRGGEITTLNTQIHALHARMTERIIFYQIHVIPLAKLIAGESPPIKLTDLTEPSYGHVSVAPGHNSPDYLGQGAFKTTYKAQLRVETSDGTALGQHCSPTHPIDVALKRPFVQPQVPAKKGTNVSRLGLAEEGQAILTEANLLAWAASLLEYSYHRIDERIAEVGHPSGFDILQLRFVNAGIAFTQKDLGSATTKSLSTRAIYLLEELIVGSQQFGKYIHNDEATPLREPDEDGYDISVFLCFIQHVQYQFSGGLVFTSDFQGAGMLLSDPQIMTHPDISHKQNLFGDGNLQSAFLKFPEQHQCNKYCTWMGLDVYADKGKGREIDYADKGKGREIYIDGDEVDEDEV